MADKPKQEDGSTKGIFSMETWGGMRGLSCKGFDKRAEKKETDEKGERREMKFIFIHKFVFMFILFGNIFFISNHKMR